MLAKERTLKLSLSCHMDLPCEQDETLVLYDGDGGGDLNLHSVLPFLELRLNDG